MTLWGLSSRVSRLKETNLSIRVQLEYWPYELYSTCKAYRCIQPSQSRTSSKRHNIVGELMLRYYALFLNRQYLETDSKFCAPRSSVASLSKKAFKIALHKIQKKREMAIPIVYECLTPFLSDNPST